jgi:hypothetical protein
VEREEGGKKRGARRNDKGGGELEGSRVANRGGLMEQEIREGETWQSGVGGDGKKRKVKTTCII